MHFSIDRTVHTTAFDKPVVDHWLERKIYSKEVFHHVRWKLKWGADTFEILGIKFSSDMKQITTINYKQEIIEMKNLIKIWSIRKLTVLGLNLLLFQKYLTY